jgi:hypothetical protein
MRCFTLLFLLVSTAFVAEEGLPTHLKVEASFKA